MVHKTFFVLQKNASTRHFSRIGLLVHCATLHPRRIAFPGDIAGSLVNQFLSQKKEFYGVYGKMEAYLG